MKIPRHIGLFSLALVSLMLALPAQAARLALVIGNDAYRNLGANGVLKNAGNDARLMAATLTSAGFEVVGGVRTNLDRNGLWDALETFKNRVGKADEVVFFYAGHGVQIDAAQYMLPTDITQSSDDQVARDALPLYRVQDHLRGARFALLVVDACRDNPFPPKPGQRSIGQSRGLVPPTQAAEGSVVVLAADKNQTALDYVPGATSANGLFTHELVRALKTPGLDVVSAVKKARAQVLASARAVNHSQKPTYVDEIAEGEFVLFASLAPVPVVPLPTPVPQATQQPLNGQASSHKSVEVRVSYIDGPRRKCSGTEVDEVWEAGTTRYSRQAFFGDKERSWVFGMSSSLVEIWDPDRVLKLQGPFAWRSNGKPEGIDERIITFQAHDGIQLLPTAGSGQRAQIIFTLSRKYSVPNGAKEDMNFGWSAMDYKYSEKTIPVAWADEILRTEDCLNIVVKNAKVP